MSMFTVVENSMLKVHGARPDPRPIERGDARALLRDRQFHVCNSNAIEALPLLTAGQSGMFVAGQDSPRRVMTLRHRFPGIPIIIEPKSVREYRATAERPFFVEDVSPLGTNPSLSDLLDVQISLGSDIAVTPTGQITAGDILTLTSVIAQASALDRKDLLIMLPLEANWLSNSTYTDQLIQELSRSRHPVALAFVDPNNPVGSARRMNALRRVVSSSSGDLVVYRTNLFGFEALSLGALSSAIGALPSVRRLIPVGHPSRGPRDPEDKSPQMLIGDILQFMPSKLMRRSWFVSVPPLSCFCMICKGDAISRLSEIPSDRILGHQHNVLEIDRIFSQFLGHTVEQKRALWFSMIAEAKGQFPQLSSYLEKEIPVPSDLEIWSRPITGR